MEGTSLGARHKDLHLQARASHQLGGIQAVYKPTGSVLLHLSCCLLALVVNKAYKD